jgi:His-Xaa-Ser system protein HxsD
MSENAATETIAVAKSVYDFDCIQRAAVTLANVAAFNFRETNETIDIDIRVRLPSTLTSKDIADRLLVELLDQRLRQQIAAETKAERDLVLAYAFSNTKIVG